MAEDFCKGCLTNACTKNVKWVDIYYVEICQILGFKCHRNVSYTAHSFGGIAGVLLGTNLLHNRKVSAIIQTMVMVITSEYVETINSTNRYQLTQVDKWEKKAKPIAFGIFYAIMICLMLCHVIGTFTGWFDQKSDAPSYRCPFAWPLPVNKNLLLFVKHKVNG